MAKLSNEELKDILIKRIEKIENSDLVDKNYQWRKRKGSC